MPQVMLTIVTPKVKVTKDQSLAIPLKKVINKKHAAWLTFPAPSKIKSSFQL